jgi:divalent metal cation (Fe/Co/Zn/Cd) transporter
VVTAGAMVSSVALIGFGIDSFVETASGAVVGWRLWAEATGRADEEHVEQLERRAGRIAGNLLLGLAAYIVIVMPALGWTKLRAASSLRSGALRADAYETIACSWLSLTTLVGLLLNALCGWWWADPLAALAIVPLVIREGLEGLRAECHGSD